LKIVRSLFGGRGHLVVALVACLACAGTATAATLITGKQVKDGSLTGKDVKDRSLTSHDFKGSLKGPKGDQGEPGTPGGAVAYAKVKYSVVEGQPTYTLDADNSKNINAVNRTGSASNPATAIPGIVCIDVSVPVKVAVATADRVPVDPSVIANVQMPTTNGADRCPPGSDAAVLLKDANDATTEASFYVIFE
jgi:hypothetical protein